ncbi:MAG: LysM peptidoglycan-binding domain-containing protein [Planctomycetota bacterium]|nr:LysM peptidoglycan-binding domain-containing protein [Planctomycetota bacterium]
MSVASARVGAGFLALVAVWVGVYWMWEPSDTPRLSFAAEDEQEDAAIVEPVPDVGAIDPEPAADTLTNPALSVHRTDDAGGTDESLSPPAFQEYSVRSGDTFERISRRFYGTIHHAGAIAAANPFVSPTSLRVGQVLRVPASPENVQGKPAAGEETDLPEPEFLEYVVVRGDNLSTLAQRFYGSLRYADVIFSANRDSMDSIDDLRVGQTLRIPSRANVLGEDGEE